MFEFPAIIERGHDFLECLPPQVILESVEPDGRLAVRDGSSRAREILVGRRLGNIGFAVEQISSRAGKRTGSGSTNCKRE